MTGWIWINRFSLNLIQTLMIKHYHFSGGDISNLLSLPVCQKLPFVHSHLLSHPDAEVSPWQEGKTPTLIM